MQASNIVLESTEVHLLTEKLKQGLELLLEYSHFSSYPLHSTQMHKYLFTDEKKNLLKNYLFTHHLHLHFTYYDLKSDAASCHPQAKWSCKGVKLFQICSYSEDAERGYGTLVVVQ